MLYAGAVLCAVALLAGCSPTAVSPPVTNRIASVTPVSFLALPDVKEPSGIVYHPDRGTLFIVGDGGDIYELDLKGTVLRTKHVRNADFEGITVNPASGLLYIVIEGEDRIMELQPDSLKVVREFPVERFYKGRMVLQPGGNGLEAIAFVPDASLPGGGNLYVANQSRDTSGTNDSSAVLALQLPLAGQTTNIPIARITAYYPMTITDISDLSYNAAAGMLYMLSDKNNLLCELSLTGTVLASCPLPGKDQEGITQTPDGMLYITQDSGGMLKCTLTRKPVKMP